MVNVHSIQSHDFADMSMCWIKKNVEREKSNFLEVNVVKSLAYLIFMVIWNPVCVFFFLLLQNINSFWWNCVSNQHHAHINENWRVALKKKRKKPNQQQHSECNIRKFFTTNHKVENSNQNTCRWENGMLSFFFTFFASMAIFCHDRSSV